jgi:hypothetical protein
VSATRRRRSCSGSLSAADVKRSTRNVIKAAEARGLKVASVEEVEIAPLHNAKCARCGKPCMVLSIMLCDTCLDRKLNG